MWFLAQFQRLVGVARVLLLDSWSSRALVWSAVGVLFATGLYRYASITLPNLDVSWLLIASERLLAGGTFRNDFYEVNWLMAIMIYCPGVWLSQLLGIGVYTGLVIFILTLIGGSVFAARQMLLQVIPEFPAATGFLTVAYAWILFFPHHFFGQREHLAMVLYLPFVIAAAGRAAGRPLVNPVADVSVSAAAAIGILIKPHFILLPAAVFAMRLLRERSWRVLLQPDVLTFLVFGIVYLASIILFYPGWIDVANMALQVYSAYDKDWDALLQTAGTTTGLAVLILIGNRFSNLPLAAKSLIFHLGITVVVGSIVFVLQRKGWSYQFLPAKISAALLIPVFLVFHIAAAEPVKFRRPLLGYFSALCAVLIGLLPVGRDIWRDYHRLMRYHNAPLTQAVRATMPGEPLFVFSADVRDAFPMVLLEKRVWASRFPSLWPIPGIVNGLAMASTAQQRERLQSLRQGMIEKTLTDFRRYRPGLVLVPIELNKRWFETDFDFLTFYRADPAFDAVWRGYRPAGRAGNFEFYVRAAP
ncbi:MAG: hypothetical protein OEU46_05645 [Alphaproteobacteria bacterium]|nr:hypothetical protein [Alphaproteobacteria bacterium]